MIAASEIKRIDPADGKPYTRSEFVKLHGEEGADDIWASLEAQNATTPSDVVKTRVGPSAARNRIQRTQGVERTRIGPSRKRGQARRVAAAPVTEDVGEDEDSSNLLAAANVIRMSRQQQRGDAPQNEGIRRTRVGPGRRNGNSGRAALKNEDDLDEDQVQRTRVGPGRGRQRRSFDNNRARGVEHGTDGDETISRTRVGPGRRNRAGARNAQVSRPSRGENITRTRVGPSRNRGSQRVGDERVANRNAVVEDGDNMEETVTRTRIGPAGRGYAGSRIRARNGGNAAANRPTRTRIGPGDRRSRQRRSNANANEMSI